MSEIKGKYIIIATAGLVILTLVVLSVSGAGKALASSVISSSTQSNGNDVLSTKGAASNSESTNSNGQYQEATLSMKDSKYVMTPSMLKKDVPVRLTVDTKTVVGCAADVTIREFGVRKYVRANDNIITFTPTKTGTITIACSMNMYFGSFQVVDEANPNAPAEVQQAVSQPAQSTGGTCGAATSGTGGCGCGMNRNV